MHSRDCKGAERSDHPVVSSICKNAQIHAARRRTDSTRIVGTKRIQVRIES